MFFSKPYLRNRIGKMKLLSGDLVTQTNFDFYLFSHGLVQKAFVAINTNQVLILLIFQDESLPSIDGQPM